MARGNMRFSLEVGALYRGSIRRAFDKMEFDLRQRDPDTFVYVKESKGFIESTFYIEIVNIRENDAQSVKRSIEGWVEQLSQ